MAQGNMQNFHDFTLKASLKIACHQTSHFQASAVKYLILNTQSFDCGQSAYQGDSGQRDSADAYLLRRG